MSKNKNSSPTRYMTRIFSAMQNQEDLILGQTQNDLAIALEDGSLDTDELNFVREADGSIVVTDKETGEVTLVTAGDGYFELANKMAEAQTTEDGLKSLSRKHFSLKS